MGGITLTRINVVPVSELTREHLVAEYRELPRISKLARVLKPSQVPKDYKLGAGHMYFFYDKGLFLKRRFEDEIVPEMHRRGYVTKYTKYREHPAGLNKDYIVTDNALRINRARIKERLKG